MWDFWPFNMAPSEGWAILYLVMASCVTVVTYWICAAIGRAGDRQQTTAADAPHPRLTIGYIPRADEWWAIAYLRGGTTGVAQTLVGAAISEGRLVFDESTNEFRMGAGTGRLDPLMQQFLASVSQTPLTPTSVRTSADRKSVV